MLLSLSWRSTLFKKSWLSKTAEPFSASLILFILQTVRGTVFLLFRGKIGKICYLIFLRNNSRAGEPFGGFHLVLDLNEETSESISWFSFLQYHFHLSFLASVLRSLCKSSSFVNDGVGEKPKPFSRNLDLFFG